MLEADSASRRRRWLSDILQSKVCFRKNAQPKRRQEHDSYLFWQTEQDQDVEGTSYARSTRYNVQKSHSSRKSLSYGPQYIFWRLRRARQLPFPRSAWPLWRPYRHNTWRNCGYSTGTGTDAETNQKHLNIHLTNAGLIYWHASASNWWA